MCNRIIITEKDYQRLKGLAEFASFATNARVITNKLVERIETARVFPQKQIASNVITMNTRVKVKEFSTGGEAEITITYPQNAEPPEGRVSVLSEIGLALLGQKEKGIVSWQVPGGISTFQVEKILYQPEAAGDYLL